MWIKYDNLDIQRWYKETVKQPEVGDSIKVITDLYEEHGIAPGSIHTVNKISNGVMLQTDGLIHFLHSTEFVVLEKTNTILVEGKEYQEGSEAKEGEQILMLRANERKGYKAGDILTVEKIEGEMLSARNSSDEVFSVWDGEFVAIKPFTQKGSVERRVLERFDETEKSILASDINLEDAFTLILQFRSMKKC